MSRRKDGSAQRRSGGRLRRAGLLVSTLAALTCGQRTTEPTQATTVAEAGWSFGFCLGPCLGQMTLSGRALNYRITSREGELFADNRGNLTAIGAERLAALVAALPSSLDARYGCPDCADAGAAFLELRNQGERRKVEYEYRSAPASLRPLDAFLSGIMDDLGACRATQAVVPEVGCSAFER